MTIAALLISLALQTASAPAPVDAKPAPWAHDENDVEMLRQKSYSPGGLKAAQSFGICVADNSTAKAAKMLSGDFRDRSYRSAMNALVEANKDCPSSRGWRRLEMGQVVLAGAIAERLIERDPTPINVRLAKAAAGPATQSFSPTDTGAICVVRSSPDAVGALFATEVGSEPEAAAARPLQSLLSRCMNGQPVEVSMPGLRSILATAAYRSVAALPATSN